MSPTRANGASAKYTRCRLSGSGPDGFKTTLGATVQLEVSERLGIEFPISAFTHCRDVAEMVEENIEAVERVQLLDG